MTTLARIPPLSCALLGFVLLGLAAPVQAQPDAGASARVRLPEMPAITETSAWSWLETRRDTVSRMCPAWVVGWTTGCRGVG